ncbi:YicC/YloC family endoribonuclease [Aquibacillus sediminis]|uniref:YicC/YloC family endoribonuclease n=1 Tax=Aquibacillus sediminis TaxID=2574734 RepID=UPI001108FD4B|nr:YicC/YloC family endoribonuclease [Aquibacillus sediminis]
MVLSMTGYGRNEMSIENMTVAVEIRSVNHRFLDISLKMPRSFMVMEERIKKAIKSYFHRGRIEVFISLEGEGSVQRDLIVDWDLMDQYIHSLKQTKERYQLEGDIPMEVVTQMDSLFSIQEKEYVDEDVHETIYKALDQACQQVISMRKVEGEQLGEDLLKRMDFIQKTVEKLGNRRNIVIIEYQERIQKRIAEHLQEEQLPNQETKLYQDIALLAEKGDITEEVIRLQSHAEQFLETIKQQGAVGRKLDFILQEMHRETNTIGSKSNDVQISELIVLLKSEIERVKEQIQNVE